MNILLYIFLFYFIPFAGMYKLFEKANQPSSAAFIPFYNAFIVSKIIGCPKWWLGMMFVPIVHLFIISSMLIEMNKSFGRYEFLDNFLGILFPFAFYPYLATQEPKYLHPSWAVQNDL